MFLFLILKILMFSSQVGCVALTQKIMISVFFPTHAFLPYQIQNEVKKPLTTYYPKMG
jgi:hypothetical protein